MIEMAIALLVGLAVGFFAGWQYGVFRVGLELEELEAIIRFRHAMQQKEVLGRLRQTAQAQRSKCQN